MSFYYVVDTSFHTKFSLTTRFFLETFQESTFRDPFYLQILFVVTITVLIIEVHIYYAAAVNSQSKKQRLQLSYNASDIDTKRTINRLQKKEFDQDKDAEIVEGIQMASFVAELSDDSHPLTVLGFEASTSVVASILTTLLALLSSIASALIQAHRGGDY